MNCASAPRFASIYKYDERLFGKLFLGETGVLFLVGPLAHTGIVQTCVGLHYFRGAEDLEDYWAHNSNTEWFQNHPQLQVRLLGSLNTHVAKQVSASAAANDAPPSVN
jgi:hypothetical protein